jgi:methyl-accepting chemotaxis protein
MLSSSTMESKHQKLIGASMSGHAMPPRKKAQAVFASAVILLCLSGLATYLTIVRLLESEKWVVHTHEVQAALGDVDSAVLNAGRACSGYVITGSTDFLSNFEIAAPRIYQSLLRLRELTKDNPQQRDLCTRLQEMTTRRVALFQQSIELKKTAPQDQQGQADISRRGLSIVSEIASTIQQMKDEEQSLLDARATASKHCSFWRSLS